MQFICTKLTRYTLNTFYFSKHKIPVSSTILFCRRNRRRHTIILNICPCTKMKRVVNNENILQQKIPICCITKYNTLLLNFQLQFLVHKKFSLESLSHFLPTSRYILNSFTFYNYIGIAFIDK